MSMNGITARAEREYKEYIHIQMIEAFKMAQDAVRTLVADGLLKVTKSDELTMMITKEFFRATATPKYYWVNKRKAEILKELEGEK